MDVLSAWRDRFSRNPVLSWLGGEPLLLRQLPVLEKRAESLQLPISMTTNGSTLHIPAIRERIAGYYQAVTFSIDGDAAFHDSMRGMAGLTNRLGEGIKALRALSGSSSSPKLRANVVLMRTNYDMLEELCVRLKDWGINEITINQLGGRDRPEFFPENRLNPDQASKLQSAIERIRGRFKSTVTITGGNDYWTRIRASAEDVPLPIGACRVAEQFIFIDEQGWMAPCSFDPEKFGVNVDSIKEAADLETISDRLGYQQRNFPIFDCANCPSTQQFGKFSIAQSS